MVGIISNSAAIFAQRNLEAASAQSNSSIARLSSGEAIIRAADDVAGLAIGTVLKSTVSTLKTVLNSTAQANSLLSIADGGLKNIGDILQRQKALAVSANSGSLSSNERAFLDQEFQGLVLEIDRIVTNTNFNNVKLLNGDIAGSATFNTSATTADGDYTLIASTSGAALGTAALAGTPYTSTLVTATSDDFMQGTFGTFTSTTTDEGSYATVAFSVVLGGATFVSTALTEAADSTEAATLTFTEQNATGVAVTFELALKAALTLETGANTVANGAVIASNITADLSGFSVAQNRDVTIVSTAASGTVLEGITAGEVTLTAYDHTISDDSFGNIGLFSFTAGSGTSNVLQVSLNGITFKATDLDGTDSDDVFAVGTDIITLISQDAAGNDTNRKLIINTASASAAADTDIDLANADEFKLLTDALDKIFASSATGGLTFQTGTVSSDSIGVTLSSSATTSLYLNSSSTAVVLDVKTAAAAVIASDVLDTAINTVTALRATIGALQSRFDFAASNLRSSIENSEAARSNFLDVDIAAESTAFATAQVRLQASISVLAQANQIPQNLLKLIG